MRWAVLGRNNRILVDTGDPAVAADMWAHAAALTIRVVRNDGSLESGTAEEMEPVREQMRKIRLTGEGITRKMKYTNFLTAFGKGYTILSQYTRVHKIEHNFEDAEVILYLEREPGGKVELMSLGWALWPPMAPSQPWWRVSLPIVWP